MRNDELLGRLRAAGATVATAESLTGGLLAAELTAKAGASAVMRGGIVAYATDLKQRLLDVPAALLAAHGPVDPQVAAAMALGVRQRCSATWGLATTGVAGPDPQGPAPVGTVYLAAAGPRCVVVERWRFSGDRSAVRAATVRAALALLASLLAPGPVRGTTTGTGSLR